ncbi:hypothetical protein [Parasitella parasitica]|uniref:Uncharacterized protein n=1 Tax=Parasitella parasitica TaxID=35722 RepID=A0A0B7N800_9FUNG|nr:hypothetical protein [Parasitella parasitica]
MSLKIYFEDGKGNAMDEDGREPVQMEINEDAYPLDSITDFNTHAVLKPPEKEVKLKAAKEEESASMLPSTPRPIKKHGDEVKELFFFQVHEKGLTAGKAAKIVDIPRRTAYNWTQEDQDKVERRLKDEESKADEIKKEKGWKEGTVG